MTDQEFIDDCRKRTPTARINTGTGKMLEQALQRLAARRDTVPRERVRELVEAVERYNRCPLDAHDRPESWDAIADIQAAAAQLKDRPTHFCNKCGYTGTAEEHDGCNYLAAQLKEQNDE